MEIVSGITKDKYPNKPFRLYFGRQFIDEFQTEEEALKRLIALFGEAAFPENATFLKEARELRRFLHAIVNGKILMDNLTTEGKALLERIDLRS